MCHGGACAALACHVAETLSSSVVSTVESVSHSHSWSAIRMWSAISTSAVPASSSVHVPAVSASVYGVEVRASEEEVVSARVSCVDGEMPVASVPVEWAIEVSGSQEGSVLPVEENVAQVGVALSPVCSIQVVVSVYPHEVIQVHFVCSLILVVGKIDRKSVV